MEGRFIPPRPKKWTKRRVGLIVLSLLIVSVLLVIVTYLAFPYAFQCCISVQRRLVFPAKNDDQPKESLEIRMPAYRAFHLSVKDLDDYTNVTIGLWHILPTDLAFEKLYVNDDLDFDAALKNTSTDVLLYLHGFAVKDRAHLPEKYQILRHHFHILALEYRSYGDSSQNDLSEDAVANDCLQVYKWLRNATSAKIFIWGHSLGGAIAAKLTMLASEENLEPSGLILESTTARLSDQVRDSLSTKIFAPLPYFDQAILDPLLENGFVFNTANYLGNTSCPVLLLHSESDQEVSFKYSRELFEVANSRNRSFAQLHLFDEDLHYNHYELYKDPFFEYFVMNFVRMCKNEPTTVD